MNLQKALVLLFSLIIPVQAMSQHTHAGHQHHASVDSPSQFLMGEAAGTALNPQSSPMAMAMTMKGRWMLMAHGYVFLNTILQSGPRGGDDFFSTNHLMLHAQRELNARSAFLVRAMLSLEPATITNRRYPLLFQTGETAFGVPIVDGQHPHDFFMELSVQYAVQLNNDFLLHFYAAPRGDPALGPVAYPHRLTAQEMPQATLSHHLQDSTHIASDVLTGGIQYRWMRVEICGFHGAEPDEKRWGMEQGAINSWSTRVNFTPTPAISAQVSTGHLKNPEINHPDDVQRTTAALTYNRQAADGFWATSFIYGTNHKREEDLRIHSFTVESLWNFHHKNFLTGRLEIVDKDELFSNDPELERQFQQQVFNIKAFTFGYSRDVVSVSGWQTGIGSTLTVYSFPDALNLFYGNNPKTFVFFLRIRPPHAGH